MLVNSFWADLAIHITSKGINAPFLTQNFIETPSSFTELMGVLTFYSLPFEAKQHKYESIKRGMQITAASNMIIFHKDIKEGQYKKQNNILIAQRFFDPNDRYKTSEDDPSKKTEKEVEEYLINKVYGC